MSKSYFLVIIFCLLAPGSICQAFDGGRSAWIELCYVGYFDLSAYWHNNEAVNIDNVLWNVKNRGNQPEDQLKYNLFSFDHKVDVNDMINKMTDQIQRDRIIELKRANEVAAKKLKDQKTFIYILIFFFVLSAGLLLFIRFQYRKFQLAYYELFNKDLGKEYADGYESILLKEDEIKNGLASIKDEEVIYLKIKEMFDNQKVFLQKDLSITKLANEIGTNTSYLSAVINNRFNMSFKTLLNKFRIDEARKLLVSEAYSCYSIEGIASEVGYHSRSTFYQVFRLQTGLTPTSYVKNHEKGKSNDLQAVKFQFEKLTLN